VATSFKESYPGFCRPLRNITEELAGEYETKIQSYKKGRRANEFESLFHECFEHHVTEAAYELHHEFELSGDERVVKLDNITASFLSNYYNPPKISKTESADKVDRERNRFSYASFFDAVTRNAITTHLDLTERLGSTKISYLIGDIGIGKSTLIAKVLFDLHTNLYEKSGKIIPVSFCFETNWKKIHGDFFEDIDDRFWAALFSAILDECRECALRTDLDISRFYSNPRYDPAIPSIKSLVAYLHRQGYRIVLALDNIDRYYFSYSKYSFFDAYNNERTESIEKNIREVIQTFEAERKLGFSGLSVVIACRDYVYKNIPLSVAREAPHVPSSDVFQIERPHECEVVGARFRLLFDIIDVVKQGDQSLGKEFEQTSKSLEEFLNAHPEQASPGLQTVFNFCQQGHRTLVEFMAGLRVDYKNYEVLTRIFREHSTLLVILFMANGYKRYTQKERFFPNMFLVDALVDQVESREEAHRPHKHTYWLKYLILKFISVRQHGGTHADVGDVVKTFSGTDRYEEWLVRLALGSLCSEDEYRCVDIVYSTHHRFFEDRRLRLTKRGDELLNKNQRLFAKRQTPTEFCFSFLYLHVICDDYLFALPCDVYKDIVGKPSFSHFYLPKSFYGKEASGHIVQRANAVTYFLGVIFASLEVEAKNREGLFSELKDEGILPNEETVCSAIDDEITLLASHVTPLKSWETVGRKVSRIKEKVMPIFEAHYKKKELIRY